MDILQNIDEKQFKEELAGELKSLASIVKSDVPKLQKKLYLELKKGF